MSTEIQKPSSPPTELQSIKKDGSFEQPTSIRASQTEEFKIIDETPTYKLGTSSILHYYSFIT